MTGTASVEASVGAMCTTIVAILATDIHVECLSAVGRQQRYLRCHLGTPAALVVTGIHATGTGRDEGELGGI